MIEVQLTPAIRNAARKEALTTGPLQGSILGGMGNLYGAIGEIIVAEYTGATRKSTPDYDMMAGERKIDVKAKHCTTPPLPHYACTVAAHGSRQKCDEYVFVRVLKDLSRAWILGSISKDKFFDMAEFKKRGEINPDNGFIVRADSYDLAIEDLEEVWPANQTDQQIS